MKNDVKQRILLEASQLIFHYGVKAMTMDELAKRIGVSKRTIYEHFEDKDALLTAICQYHQKANKTNFKKVLEESSTIIHAMFYWYDKNIANVSFEKILLLYDEIKRYHPAVYQKEILKNINQKIEDTKNILQLGVKQGVFRKNLDIDIATMLLLSFFQQLKDDTDGIRQQFPIERLHSTYMEIFVRGCCSNKGIQAFEDLRQLTIDTNKVKTVKKIRR